jgi:4-aminobutyrate aminotransferase
MTFGPQSAAPRPSEGDSNQSPYRNRWLEHHVDAATRRLLERDEQVFLRQSLSTPCLDVLEEAFGSSLRDVQGRTFLDFHGNSVHQVGYGHPRVVRAVVEQLQRLPFCPRRYTNRPAIELGERLRAIAPMAEAKILLAPGGTSAVGMALKLARMATGRFKTISMWESFHGASLDAISLGGESLFRQNIGPLLPGTEHVPPADAYRCLWNPGGNCETCDGRCARYLEYVLEQEGDVAAVVAEPIRCTSVNPAPPGYWRRVRRACDRHGTLLIFDETAVCLGRTGTMFACEQEGVAPDILIIGKGLGGGIFPLAAILARQGLDIAPDRALGHYTHEKNPLACSAALATIDIIIEDGLCSRAEILGRKAVSVLRGLAQRFPLIGDVRGRGLLFGADLVVDRLGKEPATDAADRILYHCLDGGLSFKVSHGGFLTLTPPLTIGEDELDRALGILAEAFTALPTT